MNPIMRFSLQMACSILSLVSIVFTVLLWSGLPEIWYMKGITGFAGFALELCKFSLLPLAVLCLKNKEIGQGIFLGSFGAVLFAMSIGASVVFMESNQVAKDKRSVAGQQWQETIRQLDKKIALAEVAAEEDIAGSYRTRGLETLKNVSEWQKERKQLLDSPLPDSGGDGLSILGLSKIFRMMTWIVLSFLIDGCNCSYLTGKATP